MATVGVSGGGFSFNICSVGGTWSWKVTADNVVSSGQLFYVTDIWTPFGRLPDVDVPIPGEVVSAMADSLLQFQQQLAPLLLLSSPSSLSVVVTEGDPTVDVGNVAFTNAGAFGSFMNVTASTNAPWSSASPSFQAGIGKNQAAAVTVRVNPVVMLSSSSPYSGVVSLQDNRVPSTVVPVQVNVTVLPRPTISVSSSSVLLTFDLSSQVPGGPQVVTVSNVGPATSVLSYSLSKVQNVSPWLAMSPMSDGPVQSGGTSNVTFSVVASAVPRIAGTYTETVRVSSGNASNSPVVVSVSLVVSLR